jgi:hypothetical protein
MRAIGWGGLGLLWVACASAKAAAPAASPATLAPLPRSSLAAVLEHRAELGLTEEQVEKLQARDDQREKADASLRDELAAASHGSGSTSSEGSPAPSSSPGGGMGGHRGGGRMGRSSSSPAAAPGSHAQAIQTKLDDDDTRAFLEAEPVFTDAQREKAEDIAGAYRAQLFDRRTPPPP